MEAFAHVFSRSLLSTAAFSVGYNLLLQYVKDQKWFKALEGETRLLFLNFTLSLAHALVAGSGALYCLYRQPDLLHSPLTGDSWLTELMVSISNGYFLYDLLEMNMHRLFLKGTQILVHVHHVVVMACFSAALYSGTLTGYLLLTLVCEVNNWFLHGSKMLRKLGFGMRHPLHMAFDALFVLTALTTRVGVHVWIVVKLLEDYGSISTLNFATAFSGMVAINFLNLMLLRDFYLSRARVYSGKEAKAA